MNPTDGVFRRALSKLLDEIFDGPPGVEAYLLNAGDRGLLGELDAIPADTASALTDSGKASIAAHVEHVLYGLALLIRWFGGESDPFSRADYTESWRHTSVRQDEWTNLREALRRAATEWRDAVATRADWDDAKAAGAMASAAHTAYHLGAIRQILAAHRPGNSA